MSLKILIEGGEMTKFNAKIFTTKDGTQVHFITRTRGKLISEEEMMEYAKEVGLITTLEEDEKDWKPASPKMFLIDLRSGLAFCSHKYGVSESTVERYIKEMAPHINSSFYNGPGVRGQRRGG